MILRRPIEFFYCWLSLIAIFLSGCSSIEKNHRGVNRFYSARSVLKSWRRKAQEQSARLFDRLPKNPEVFYTPPEVIRSRGYPVEVHHITTDDGYILEIHRIPAQSSSGPKKAVFLQHGVLESSGTWLVNPSKRALPFLLADKSYDVWIGNFRGNRYSRRHVTLNPSETEFWKFSWDEIGNYDLPAVINYILKTTGQSKLSYIGHSLGCGTFFIAMVKHPELNSKIDIMVALAPLSSFAHFTTALFRFLAPLDRIIQTYLQMVGTWGWLDSEGFGDRFFNSLCGKTYTLANRCADVVRAFTGPNPSNNYDPTIVPVMIANVFRGTSVPVIAQFAQNFHAGETFQAYDYGPRENIMRYGSTRPMEYHLDQITAPIYVFSGGNDHIVTPLDVDWLLTQLKNMKGSTRIPEYNHGDFVWGTDVKDKLYDQVMALLPPPLTQFDGIESPGANQQEPSFYGAELLAAGQLVFFMPRLILKTSWAI
ncbi:hypothetical protein DAPPUDRAFT_223831 [Daphnia pulex]|uniref:Partial AB-hydrolase lipase domain-containing protein n=1 Tax=Daphnia pulex TaxID=6669 RepID=E9GDV5_DAPPU|nr:hypothetical protein DAPPUDRAFT_223831 [Daphnia pulex]|eukprot:EFX82413.1 hypothetical protein DAPPUDRAFT_223831 [Daphnia pulex]